MPTYSYRCPDGTVVERVRTIEMRKEPCPCPDGGLGTLIPSVPRLAVDLSPLIEGEGTSLRDLERAGKRVWEPGMDRDIARVREEKEAKHARDTHERVAQIVRDLTP